jgi:hypothetical protein
LLDEPQIKQAVIDIIISVIFAGGSSAEDAKEVELMLAKLELPATIELLSQLDIWICDTGASCHSTYSPVGAINIRNSGISTVGHIGQAVTTTKTIDIPSRFVSPDGTCSMSGTLTEVGLNPKMNYNLMSLSGMLMKGWRITKGDSTGITIADRRGNVIDFDIVIKTARGAVFAVRFIHNSELNAASTEEGVKMTIDRAHALLGYGDEQSTRESARALGWVITRGSLKPCVHCAKAKAKQKNTAKVSVSENKAKKPGERLHVDLSTISVPKPDGTLHRINQNVWRIAVDECTGKKWGGFHTTKIGMVEPMCELLNQLKARNIPVLTIRLDSAGENFALEKRCKSAAWASLQPLTFEFTSRNTPQHNSKAETAFPTIANRAKAAINAAWIPYDQRANISIEALMYTLQLDGLRLVEVNGVKKTRDEHVFGSNPKWVNYLRSGC